jgi:putative transcriptional regulator
LKEKGMPDNRKYNRIRVVLADRERTIKWLAGQLDKKPNTVSRWCRNEMQPSIETFYRIAEVLKVEIYDLLNPLSKVDEEF